MSDNIVDNIRKENYLIEILKYTKDSKYVKNTTKIIKFVNEIYRTIEPSHFDGKIIVFIDLNNNLIFEENSREKYYDNSILNHDYDSMIFQVMNDNNLPLIWINKSNDKIQELLDTTENFIAYIFDGDQEYFIVNKEQIQITNNYSCPSIFALQYHDLNLALLEYRRDRIRFVSCEHFKNCWADNKRIYLKNKPETCMQISLKEFLINRIRGIDAVREYNLGASKPVDIRVFWREANRASLIELKWLGQSLKENEEIGTSYSNCRGNDGIEQVKEYIDLERGDTPSIITKGYLVVIDCRRKRVSSQKLTSIPRADGMYYADKELDFKEELKYWDTFPNIEKPIRMFAEPICEICTT